MNSSILSVLILIPLLLAAVPVSAQSGVERTLVDFSQPGAKAWPALNDGVMGGRSRGGGEIVDGKMLFTGETRLENNGGFSSLRSRGEDFDLEGATDLLVRIKASADRKYTMILETSSGTRWRSVSYWRPFEVAGEGWQVLRMPLADFYPTFRGMRLKGPELAKSDVSSIGVMVYDKKAGPFRVEIDWVKASFPGTKKSVDTARLAATTETAPQDPNIVELAQAAGSFKTLLAAAGAAGLAETLTSPGPFTVLAPTDEAFAALPKGTVENLLKPENKEQLQAVLLYHVLPGRLNAGELLVKGKLATVQGQEVGFKLENGRLTAGGAKVLLNDLAASNGIVHAIDRVLLPELAAPAGPVQKLIERAIDQGVDQFNAGNVAACAAIYEIAVMALVELEAPELDVAMRRVLASALKSARANEDRREAAWTLRRAMDTVWASVTG